MNDRPFVVEPIGVIHSALTDRKNAPRQGDKGGYEAWLELEPHVRPGLLGIGAGDEVIILTWLHLAQRDVLQVHPHSDGDRPLKGVFATRSSDRPNPIGLHRVSVLAVDDLRLRIAPIEAVDGTPVIDIKIVRTHLDDR
ncbi:MAG: tRNA (N6-threonylcarbamoyladenosine(37)-N6)-methyltransferase TrmO [Anaerolineaceae bacterium]|nr:tRNA (N6-threonylcarbamoyladenosine(37)-N6)-methyltransferase TrmO [Anaerolineaceae bacterium]